MHGVYAVDRPLRAVLGVVGLVGGHAQLLQRPPVGAGLVGGHDRALVHAAAQHLHGPRSGEHAAARHGEEQVSRVAHAGHHAYLLGGEPPLAHLARAVAARAGQREVPLGVVALEGLGEVRLVELAAHAVADREGAVVVRKGLYQAVAHREGRLERDAALLRAGAERPAPHEALGVAHPDLLGQAAAAPDALGARAERAPAVLAQVALLALLGEALLDHAHRPAPRAAAHLRHLGRVVEQGGADHPLHLRDGLGALLGPQRGQVPLEFFRYLRRLHARTSVTLST